MRSNILFILLIGAIGVQTITSCTDTPTMEFPSEEEVNRRASSSSTEAAVSSSSSEASSSSTEAAVSSSSSARSSSSALKECNGTEYDPLTQFCYNSSKIGNFCGNNPQKSYNPDFYGCEPGSNGIYLKNGVRDGSSNEYKAVLIGGQVWMAENLNYNMSGSVCAQNSEPNCTLYGKLYDWNTAQTACPNGWRLPSNDDWDALMNFIGGSQTAGRYLKAENWDSQEEYSRDLFGFRALPGGFYNNTYSYFSDVNKIGIWWSSTEYGEYAAYVQKIDGTDKFEQNSDNKSYKMSVRCLRKE